MGATFERPGFLKGRVGTGRPRRRLLRTNQLRGKPGKPRVDDRRIISGILHVLKTGCRWRDVPAEYGPATTIYNRYNRCMSPLVTIYGHANGFDVEGNLLMTLSGPGESDVHFP